MKTIVALFLGLTSAIKVRDPHNTDFTKGDANAWVDACDPNYEEGPMTAGHTAGAGVGVDCQGFAQTKSLSSLVQTHHKKHHKKHHKRHHRHQKAATLAQDPHNTDFTKGNANAWVDACDESYKDGAMSGQFARVGIDCQGFA